MRKGSDIYTIEMVIKAEEPSTMDVRSLIIPAIKNLNFEIQKLSIDCMESLARRVRIGLNPLLREQADPDGDEEDVEYVEMTPFETIDDGCDELVDFILDYEDTLDDLFSANEKILDPSIHNDLLAAITRLKTQLILLKEIAEAIQLRCTNEKPGDIGIG